MLFTIIVICDGFIGGWVNNKIFFNRDTKKWQLCARCAAAQAQQNFHRCSVRRNKCSIVFLQPVPQKKNEGHKSFPIVAVCMLVVRPRFVAILVAAAVVFREYPFYQVNQPDNNNNNNKCYVHAGFVVFRLYKKGA